MALSILGTISVINFFGGTTFTGSTHDVSAGTDTLLFVYITRVRDTDQQPVFGAKWNGDDLTALSTNYSGGIHGDDFAYWAAAINAPDTGVHDLVLTFGGFQQVGGTMLLINLDGNDTTNILGSIINQRRASTATNSVGPLSITPITSGDNLILAILGISQNTTLSSFTGSGYTTVSTASTTNNSNFTRTIRYKIGASGAQSVSAVFGASDTDIGGVLIEIRGASATTTDKSGDIDIGLDISGGAAQASRGIAPNAAILEGKSTFTSALILQADDTNVSRAMVRVGSNTTTRFGMKRLAIGVGGKPAVIACEALLDDGTSYVESAEGSLSTGLSVLLWTQTPGAGGQVMVDGQERTASYRSGTTYRGGVIAATNPMEVGAYSDVGILAYSGLLGRWIVDSKVWSIPQQRLFAKSILDPDRVFGWGERDTPDNTNRSPVALPLTITLIGASFLDIAPVAIDLDATQPRLVGVSSPSSGIATILDNGRIRYTPTTGFLGKDSFTYTMRDDGNKSSTAIIDITVVAGAITAVNDPISVQQGSSVTFNPASNDTGGVGALRVSAVGTPSHGTAVINSNNTITYTPDSAYTGTDTFTYIVTDEVSTANGLVTATVSATASANAVDDSVSTRKGVAIDVAVLDNDTPTGVRVDAVVTQPANGQATVKTGNTLITYTPKAGFTGNDSFTYRAKLASNNTTDTATVRVNVRDASTNRSGLPWRSGADMISDGSATQMQQFGAWRGRELDCATAFMGSTYYGNPDPSNWPNSTATRRNGDMERIKNSDRIAILAYPMLVNADKYNFKKCVNDAGYLKSYQANANELKAIYGTSSTADPVYVRIGWEANKGYPWSFDGNVQPDDYIPAWRRIADIFLNTCPNVVLVWNHLKEGKATFHSYYPGSDVVGVIGLDFYDNGWFGGYCTNETNWQKQKGVWNPSTGQVSGWEGFIKYARYLNKSLAFDEWGASFLKDGRVDTNLANNSFFVGRMFKYFQDIVNGGQEIVFENYFNGNINNRILESDGRTLTSYSTNVGKAYKAAWTP